ncbi:hypothetical protein [Paraburkholderia atlantica]|uniref:hypothetical protein n=1 Tax=Paraburkholderia atlantica TaxID=2654982 RepID=UPI0016124F6B|nr:hypothetical protein [Paraburkholderia atlantica]MBB5510640.1 hypothetical protein [Paraburkholderia atlantica]
MALISKRFSTAKKTVGPGSRTAAARSVTTMDPGTRPAAAPATATRRPSGSDGAAVFKVSLHRRLPRLKMMVDRAMSKSDETRKRSGRGKVSVKA